MLANLYLHKDAVAYNGFDSKEQVMSKMRSFADDMRHVVYSYREENVFCVSCDIFACEVYEGISFVDSIKEYLDGDQQGIMYSILANTSEEHNYSIEELQSLSQYRPDEQEINTLIVLNRCQERKNHRQYIQYDNYEVIYDQSSWFSLRRQILGNHPGQPPYFIQECKKYFKNLAFHDYCIESLCDESYNYLEIIPRRIVYYLSCLNDGFKDILVSHGDRAPDANSVLADFSGQFGLDEPGSIERDVRKKPSLTFSFNSKDAGKKEMLCEPHLKISQIDSNCSTSVNYSTFHPRIYFHFGDNSVENGRILIGSIGKHIS